MRITVESQVEATPRVQQVRGLFDLPDDHFSRLSWDVHLPADGLGSSWRSLDGLASEYAAWIQRRRDQVAGTPDVKFEPVATRHLDACAT